MGGDLKRKRDTRPLSLGSGNRKERNCAAQKAYRQRQTLYVRELEEKLHSASKSDNEHFQDLEDSNRLYRHELLEAYKKLEGTRISSSAVLRSVASAIGMQTPNRTKKCRRCEDTTSGQPESESSPERAELNLPQVCALEVAPQQQSTANFEPFLPSDDPILDITEVELGDLSDSSNEMLMTAEVFDIPDQSKNSGGVLTLEHDTLPNTEYLPYSASQLDPLMDESFLPSSQPNAETAYLPLELPYDISQMGHKNFRHMNELSPIVLDTNGHRVRRTNSPFSDHISLVEHLIRQRWGNPAASGGGGHSLSSTNYVSFMLSAFTTVSWEAMRPFWVYTKAHRPVVNVTTWRLRPDAETYARLAPWYRPMQAQLSVPHPTVIDWVPFPSLRDRLILLHSCNPRLDEIICDIADSYVMEIDFSMLVSGVESCMVYVRVLDLLATISDAEGRKIAVEEAISAPLSERTGFNTGAAMATSVTSSTLSSVTSCSRYSHRQSRSLPAPSLAAIFSSKALALDAFRLLGMDRSPGAMKLAPAFFEDTLSSTDTALIMSLHTALPYGRHRLLAQRLRLLG